MRAEIISIGTEILMGEILDTNANYMAQRLPAMGIDLFFIHQIGDNKSAPGRVDPDGHWDARMW